MGYDPVVIETVGVGQDEVEIATLAHTTVVVSVPGLGDEIQAIKAGVLEAGQCSCSTRPTGPAPTISVASSSSCCTCATVPGPTPVSGTRPPVHDRKPRRGCRPARG